MIHRSDLRAWCSRCVAAPPCWARVPPAPVKPLLSGWRQRKPPAAAGGPPQTHDTGKRAYKFAEKERSRPLTVMRRAEMLKAHFLLSPRRDTVNEENSRLQELLHFSSSIYGELVVHRGKSLGEDLRAGRLHLLRRSSSLSPPAQPVLASSQHLQV